MSTVQAIPTTAFADLSADSIQLGDALAIPTRNPASPDVRVWVYVSASTLAILGTNGLMRLREFADYRPGWRFGAGQPLSISGLFRLQLFADVLQTAPIPSMFMTEEGFLALSWSDAEGKRIDVECTDNSLEFYYQATQEERSIAPGDIPLFVPYLRSLFAHDLPA